MPESQPAPLKIEEFVAKHFPTLRERYIEAVRGYYCPWASKHPRDRFAEYDQFRAIWCDEIWQWLYGGNPRDVHTLTALAWAAHHARISEGGYKINCLNFSDRRQRVFLGDGLMEYLGLLKDEITRVYNAGGKPQAPRE